jgi:serine/threonine protein kinase
MAATEIAAAAVLQDCSAVLVPADAVGSSNRSGDIVLVSQYAGTNIEQLVFRQWRHQDQAVLLERAKQVLVCMLLGLDELSRLKVAQLYRDFKTGNMTYDEELDIFRIIDFGLMIAADKSDYSLAARSALWHQSRQHCCPAAATSVCCSAMRQEQQ